MVRKSPAKLPTAQASSGAMAATPSVMARIPSAGDRDQAVPSQCMSMGRSEPSEGVPTAHTSVGEVPDTPLKDPYGAGTGVAFQHRIAPGELASAHPGMPPREVTASTPASTQRRTPHRTTWPEGWRVVATPKALTAGWRTRSRTGRTIRASP
jgi:hypothetical protein